MKGGEWELVGQGEGNIQNRIKEKQNMVSEFQA